MIRSFAATLLATSLVLAACAATPYDCIDPLGCLEITPGSPIVIGALLTVYGSQGEAGLQALDEIKTSIKQNSTILDHEIKLILQTTDCSEENARLSATLLAGSADLAAVIGPSSAADAPIALPILRDAGLAVLAPAPNASDAFRRLVLAIQEAGIQQENGSLVIPRTTFQERLQIVP